MSIYQAQEASIQQPQEKPFPPTYLYIKQHSVTGLLYFGKTILNDPIKYKGSGTYWKRHIKKHGIKHVETLWYCLFTDKESIREFGLLCSLLWDICASDCWGNILKEDGIQGTVVGATRSLETRQKIALSKTGTKLSNDHKNKISLGGIGRKNSMEHIEKTRKWHLGSIRTEASKQKMKASRMLQNISTIWTIIDPNGLIITSSIPLKEFCKNNSLGLSKLRQTIKTKLPVDVGYSKGWMILHKENFKKSL